MHKCTLVCVGLLIVGACRAQEKKPYVILPPSEAQAVNRLCSRPGPGEIEEGWAPGAIDVATLEARLSDISTLQSRGAVRTTISDPFHFYRQYVGIVLSGRRLIYVNAFPPDFVPKYWQTRLMDVCDGGPAFWGVLFDPATGKFSDLKTNGVG
jgi:hypothetical protein